MLTESRKLAAERRNNRAHLQAQNLSECVRQTHATGLLDLAMFRGDQPEFRISHAIKQVQWMGYEFHIVSSEIDTTQADQVTARLKIRNTGVAPFYHDWKVELARIGSEGSVTKDPVESSGGSPIRLQNGPKFRRNC